MSKILKAIFLGTILLGAATGAGGGEEPAAPSRDAGETPALQEGATSRDENAAGTPVLPEKPKLHPRESAASYAAHGELAGLVVGATLLTSDEVRQVFTTDLDRCCLVVEVGLYPAEGKTAEITRQNFTLRIVRRPKEIAAKASSPQMLALTLQLTSRTERPFTPHGEVGVTAGSGGIDPVTGQPRGRGIGTSASVGASSGEADDSKLTALDREMMEMELTAQGLPEGKISAPTAGYLYFQVTKKDKKKSTRELEFTQAGQKLTLTLP